ncbi:patatin-like protein 2 [Tanacetum coccineum]
MESKFFAPPDPTPDNLITILSIDGGGIRGIIPGVILEYLEAQLQLIDKDINPNAKLADYFDVIAGTSTGGLVTTMLTTPKEPGSKEPKYTAKDIVPFYREKAPKIFDQSRFKWIPRTARALWGPLYDGKDLRCIVNEFLGKETRLSDTLTNVVIPAFDIQSMRPVIFSSFKVPTNPSINASMYDMCIATTAAPTYLPGHKFQIDHQEFNLIDGGVAANNPAAVSLEEVMVHVMKDLKDSKDYNTMRHTYGQFLVLSLGTGSKNTKNKDKYDVETSSNWGVLGWLVKNGSPLMKIFTQASVDLVDYRINNVFHILQCPDKFLRIQDDTLTGDLSSVDIATEENLKALNQVGIKLLDKPVCHADFKTGEFKPVEGGGTNREALQKFAQLLSDERKKRVQMDMGDLAIKKASVIGLLKKNMGIHE